MKESSSENAFIIKTQNKKVLTKDQNRFNSLSKKIEELRVRIVHQEETLESRLKSYNELISPIELELTEVTIRLIKFLYSYYNQAKLTRKQEENVVECMGRLMEEVAKNQSLDDELKEIYDTFNEVSFDDELDEQVKELKDDLSARVLRDFGVELDFSDIDFKDMSPENQARIHSRIVEAVEEKKEAEFKYATQNNQPKKKTKSQLNREEIERQKEEIKSKSIRAIYLSLVKILHPDTETDAVKKLEKEDLMKSVALAYEANDITTLLKLEMQWLNAEKSNSLTDDKIKIYIDVLKEQVQELEQQMRYMVFQERFLPIAEYAGYTDKKFLKTINEKSLLLNEEIELFTDVINDFQDFKKHKKDIQTFVEDINYVKNLENDFMSLFDF